MKAELIIPKSNSLEDLQEYLAECSSVVRDKTPKSASKLWDRLLKESFGNTASRVFEYIPCTISRLSMGLQHQLHGFTSDTGEAHSEYHTNMRELLNWGWSVDLCLDVVDFTNYRTLKCETPYFIYGQISTHTQLTTVSHSQRYGVCDRGYWMPPEVNQGGDAQYLWNENVGKMAPLILKEFMKDVGIARKEVWDRGADMLQNRVFTIGGYMNNPSAFPHFFDQRLDLHTQLETREFVVQMKEVVDG